MHVAAFWIQGLQGQRETSFLGGLALEPGCLTRDATKKVLSDARPRCPSTIQSPGHGPGQLNLCLHATVPTWASLLQQGASSSELLLLTSVEKQTNSCIPHPQERVSFSSFMYRSNKTMRNLKKVDTKIRRLVELHHRVIDVEDSELFSASVS